MTNVRFASRDRGCIRTCDDHVTAEYLTTMPAPAVTVDTFTPEETRALAPYFTNTDRPVFALTNLPETVKGALFARYSRSAKSLRRLFLDEFLDQVGDGGAHDRGRRLGARRQAVRARAQRVRRRLGRAARRRAPRVRRRLERPDQGARVGTPDGVPRAVDALRAVHRSPGRPLEVSRARGARRLAAARDVRRARSTRAFETYARWIPAMEAHFRAKYPKAPEDSDGVYASVIRAKALDTLRGLLPAATTSNVGLFGTGQAFEALLLRMFAHPLAGGPRARRR